MKKILQISLLAILLVAKSYGQNSYWKKVSEKELVSLTKMDRATMPSKFQLFALDVSVLKSQLLHAPNDLSGQFSNVIIPFPNEDGGMSNYRIYDSPIMEQGLADKFPDVKTYLGKGIDDPTATMRFSITPFGLHVMTLSGTRGTVYIDTYTADLQNYIVYNRANLQRTRSFECGFDELNHPALKSSFIEDGNLNRTSDGNFRIYRLAMACTGEYAAFHGGTVALAQAAIVVTVNRINAIYERDFSARLNLVANNNLLIYTNAATDPYTNNSGTTMLGQNQTNITTVIGSANYDVGHVVSTNGGGVAGLGVFCNSTQKARGVTGTSSPVGDPFDIDYVAHEMGHQFGCNHTFNGDAGSCGGGNRNNSTAVEPGSGTTIMAYAGICSPQNVQSNSDAHFSFISIAEANTRTFLGTSCATVTANGNVAPTVNAGPDYVIPKGTAFILKGAATDANGDALTYCWEQTNTEISTQPPVQTATTGPNFRSNLPTTSPDRYMPRIQDVINNNLAPTWEVVPNVARTMNFALTVRDNRAPNGGQTGRDDMVVTTAAVGPFLVTAPNTNVNWPVGTTQDVTWDVAGTTANGINAATVDIFLSTDGGFTYPITLATNVPNDGVESLVIPNNIGTTNRIMVKGNNHIFYDISNTNFTISQALSDFSIAGINGLSFQSCTGIAAVKTIQYTTYAGFNANTTFTVSGQPAGATVVFSPSTINATGVVTMTVSNTAGATPGSYSIIVTATSGATVKTITMPFQLYSSTFPASSLTAPANLATAQPSALALTWVANSNATSYDVEVATVSDFSTLFSSGNVTTNTYALAGLASLTTYYWRIKPKNPSCDGPFSAAFQFTTNNISCTTTASTNVPLAISATGTPTITSTLNIPSGVTITDLNVSVNITHTYVSDLTATLTSPSGTIVQLFNQQCSNNQNINATFDDAGVALVCGTNPSISGTVIPTQALAAFNGQSATGTWVLTVSDLADVDGGSLNSWSINVCGAVPTCAIALTSASQTNVSCFGGANGAASVNTPTGGAAPYTYNWTPGNPAGDGTTFVTGLAAGTYTCTVTDANSCTTSQNFTITQPNALVATALAQTNVSCNGGFNGSATVAVGGGTPGYTYSWAPTGGTAATATGLAAGPYTVTVTDANACSTTQSFTITQPNALVATALAQTNASCNGVSNGSATVAASGGTPGYTYSWAPTGGTAAAATGLAAGPYTVTVTDANGCTTTQSFTITQPSALVATALAQTNVSCTGGSNGSATVAASGGTPGYTYSWAPTGGTAATATGLTAGSYTVTVTDANACTATQSFTITVNPPPTVNAGGAVASICQGGTTAALEGSFSGATAAVWSDGGAGGTFANNSGNTPDTTTYTAAFNAPATITLTLTTTGGACGSVTATKVLTISTGTSFYADTDGDTFGDPASLLVSCSGAPFGYVTNNTDCNPTDASSWHLGSFYTDADNDGYNNGAPVANVCYGTTVPSGYTTTNIGTDCLDTNAEVNPNHVEVLGNGIDDNCDGIIDEVAPASSVQPAQCGTTLINLAQAIYANVIYPTAAQGYRFEVTNGATVRTYESPTNSFNLLNLPGGATYNTTYSIRVAVKTGGFWRAYSSVCTISTPALPTTTNVAAAQCGVTLATISSTIYCGAVASASGYRFRINDGINPARTFDTTVNRFSLTDVAGGAAFATTYAVDVQLRFGTMWEATWGQVCAITTPLTPGTSNLSAAQCGINITNLWQTLYASQIAVASGYRFEVTKSGGSTVFYDTPNPRFSLRNITVPGFTVANASYSIRVAILYNGSYLPFGAACTITTNGASRLTNSPVAVFEVKAYPNPFANNFTLDINTSSETNVTLKVYDMIGRTLETKVLSVNDLAALELGTNYPTGVYNAIVTQGENVKTLRLVKR